MDQARWQLTEQIFHSALQHPPEERGTYLNAACGADTELRQQVEMLIANDARAGSFLERPVGAAPRVPVEPPSATLVGRQVGAYRIDSLLGAGGMGEVYRAHDDKLARDVALKALPREFAGDTVRLSRFRREARTLASLNHPNIAAIYALEELPGADFLVLELVEGESPRGPMPLATVLEIGRQVADALDAAHRRGIVHRDLKPANLKITAEGRVKVLDFGLAKAIGGSEPAGDHPEQRPRATDATLSGFVLGTPGYMSPEQARGDAVDQRADVWAFGCLLFELLSGSRPFQVASRLGGVVLSPRDEPAWEMLPADTPEELVSLLRGCLRAEQADRPAGLAGAREVLERLLTERERAVGTQRTTTTAAADRPTIRALAVLPLTNHSGHVDDDPLADGMTEALIAELGRIEALHVTSRTSAMHYRGTTKTLPEVARDLGVDGIVEGSVLRAGTRVRITAQLIHAPSDRRVWSATYERDLHDVLALQARVARAIAEEIEVTLTPGERARLAHTRPVNVEAHEACVRGRFHWGRVHPERSIEHFREAIRIDPTYAEPYAGIADALCLMYGAGMELVPAPQTAPAIREAAQKALELDETLPEPHVSLACVAFWYDRDPVTAERELRRAVELNPSCARAHFHYGLLLADVGRLEQSYEELSRALRLDPISCWNVAIAGVWLSYIGHVEEGRRQLQKALDLDATFFFSRSAHGLQLCAEGRFAEAIAEAREGVRISGGLPIAHAFEGYILGVSGDREKANDVLLTLEALSHKRYVPAAARYWCYLGLGQYDEVITWLERGFEQRDSALPHLRVFREFTPLHGNARFENLLQRIGLPATTEVG